MDRVLHGLARVWTASGPVGLAKAIRLRLWEQIRFVQFRVDLDAWDAGPPTMSPFEVRCGMPALIEYRETVGRALPVQFFQDEMHGASRPYLGLWCGEVGHISWLFTEGGHGRRADLVTLGPGEVELDGAFTLPSARGRGLLTVVEREMLRDARRDGARFAYTHVAETNVSSIKGVLRTGFRPYRTVVFYRVANTAWRRTLPLADHMRTQIGQLLPAAA